MSQVGTPLLSAWQSFYILVGSAAAAVIAIQFVVITLIANLRRTAPAETLSAFATPTVVQLGSALLVAAIMSAPWPSLCSLAIPLALLLIGIHNAWDTVIHIVVVRLPRRGRGVNRTIASQILETYRI